MFSGYLILCIEAPLNFFKGPCEGGAPTDIIIFDNGKHEVFFFSNLAYGGGEPADVPFTGKLGIPVNPRFLIEPPAVDGISTLLWSPGPDGPGFYGLDQRWNVQSDAVRTVVPEPSSLLLMATVLMLALSQRRFRGRRAEQRAAR